jgi:hypothetical protein
MLVFVGRPTFPAEFLQQRGVAIRVESGRQYLNKLGPRRKLDPALALVDQTSSSFALTRLNRARRLGARTALTSPTGVSTTSPRRRARAQSKLAFRIFLAFSDREALVDNDPI